MDLEGIRQQTDLRMRYPEDHIKQNWTPFDSAWVSARCIFHQDNHNSASVSRWGFRCHAACGVIPDNGADIFKFVMYAENVDFMEAVRRLKSELPAEINFAPVQKRVVSRTPPTYTQDDVARYVKEMERGDYDYLTARTRIEEATAEEHYIGTLPGWKERDAHLFTFPIISPEGKLVNIRAYNPNKDGGYPKYYPLKRDAGSHIHGLADLLTIPSLKEVYIVEGEKKWALGRQWGLPTVTGTAGAGTFKAEWLKYFTQFEKVYVVGDVGTAGDNMMRKVSMMMPRVAIPVRWEYLGAELADNWGLDDFIASNGTLEDFNKLCEESEKRHRG